MHVCLFDIDGTLLNSGGAGKAAMEGALAEAFGVTEFLHVPYSGRTDRAIGLDLLRLHGIEPTADHWQRLLTAYLRRLPEALNHHRGWVLPGIIALLEHLAGHDRVAVGPLTGNVRDGARLKLGHFGLVHHFPFGGFGDEHFDRDDVAREALSAVEKHLGCPACLQRVWVIGDAPLDVRCARAIGARAVAVCTGWHCLEELQAASPDLLLTDFSDPAQLLEYLC